MRLFSKICLILSFVLNGALLYAQDDAAPRKLKFELHAALLVNRAFSHYPKALSPPGRFLSIDREYKPGYNFGILLNREINRTGQFIFGLSLSNTSGEYNYYLRKRTDMNDTLWRESRTFGSVSVSFVMVSAETGCRMQVYKNWSLQPSVLFQYGFIENYKTSGIFETQEGTGNSVQTVTFTKSGVDYNRNVKITLSARLTALYNFKAGKGNYNMMLFRNFGLEYNLPWWGLGCSVVL